MECAKLSVAVQRIEKKLESVLKKYLPYENYVVIKRAYKKIISGKSKDLYREAYFISRKNGKKKYCIFRLEMPNHMIFSAGNLYLYMYDWAIHKGMIPILDVEYTYDFERYRLGEKNIWETIFEQPLAVKEVLKEDWVLVESIGIANHYLQKTCKKINGRSEDYYIHIQQRNWRNYYSKTHLFVKKAWVFKKTFLEEFNSEYGQYFKNGHKILGVSLRETFSEDEKKFKSNATAKKVYSRHPLVPGIRETLEIVKHYVNEWNCEKIFLATIMQESVDLFIQEFGDKVIVVDRERYGIEFFKDAIKTWEMTSKEAKEILEKRKARESVKPYVKEVLALSRCDCLVAAKSGGTAAALSLNGGKYEDVYILPDRNKSKRY